MFVFTDLISSYVRLHYFLTFIPEKATIISFFCGAAHYKDPTKPVPYANELKGLLDDSTSLFKHFIDAFQVYQQTILDVCFELKDSLQFASNSEIIRNMNLFNPIYENNLQLAQPTNKPVSFPLSFPNIVILSCFSFFRVVVESS